VGTGKVFAVDAELEMIAYLKVRINQEKLLYIEPFIK